MLCVVKAVVAGVMVVWLQATAPAGTGQHGPLNMLMQESLNMIDVQANMARRSLKGSMDSLCYDHEVHSSIRHMSLLSIMGRQGAVSTRVLQDEPLDY